jgi:hypothetical protein
MDVSSLPRGYHPRNQRYKDAPGSWRQIGATRIVFSVIFEKGFDAHGLLPLLLEF